jgi:hypothetical protein
MSTVEKSGNDSRRTLSENIEVTRRRNTLKALKVLASGEQAWGGRAGIKGPCFPF